MFIQVKKSNDKGGRNTSSGWFRIVSVWFTCVISKVGGYLKFWNYWSGTASEVSVNETPDAKVSDLKCMLLEDIIYTKVHFLLMYAWTCSSLYIV